MRQFINLLKCGFIIANNEYLYYNTEIKTLI